MQRPRIKKQIEFKWFGKRLETTEYPVLLGRQYEKSLLVWCPYCRTEHEHGWSEPESVYKDEPNSVILRVSHCTTYNETTGDREEKKLHSYFIALAENLK